MRRLLRFTCSSMPSFLSSSVSQQVPPALAD
jgi:hypothetical protein